MAGLPPNHPRQFMATVKKKKPGAPGMDPDLGEIKQAAADLAKLATFRIGRFTDLKDTPARAIDPMGEPGEFGLASLGKLVERMKAS